MLDILQKLTDWSVLGFVVSSLLAMGLSQRLRDVVAPLKKSKPVLLALFINFVLAPLLAIALTRLIPLQPPHAIGLLLLGAAAGAPFLPKLAELARGSLAYAVALMALLIASSIVCMPILLPLMLPGLKADPLSIAKPLVFLMLTPLVLGFALARIKSRWIPRLLTLAQRISNATFVLLLVLLVGLNLDTLAATIGSFALGTYALYVIILAGVAFWLGGPDIATKGVSALGAGQRNTPAALVIASTNFDDPAVTVMLIVATLVGFVVLLALAAVLRQRATA